MRAWHTGSSSDCHQSCLAEVACIAPSFRHLMFKTLASKGHDRGSIIGNIIEARCLACHAGSSLEHLGLWGYMQASDSDCCEFLLQSCRKAKSVSFLDLWND